MMRLVDIDLSARVIASEVPVAADVDLDVLRDALRSTMAAHVARGFNDEAATVAVTVVVREVSAPGGPGA